MNIIIIHKLYHAVRRAGHQALTIRARTHTFYPVPNIWYGTYKLEGLIMRQKIVGAVTILVALVMSTAAPVSAATPAPTTADGFTQMLADKNDMTWSGSDGAISYKAPNGKIYWINGDTFKSNGEDPDGSYPDGTTMVGNSILIQQGGELVNAMANGGMGVPDPVTHTPENNERYWPSGAVYANNHLYILCQRVVNDPGGIGFKIIGSEMAKYKVARNGLLTLVGMRNLPSTGVEAGRGPLYTQWAGDVISKGSYLYVYGQTLAPQTDPQWVIHATYLARVPTAMVEYPSAWRYYKKSTGQWVNSVSKLSQATNNPDALVESQVSSVRTINGKVVMVHKPWNNWGTAVYAEIGANPWGPFTTKHIFDSPAGSWEGKNYETYGPVLHPEQLLGGTDTGKILVSINWNGVDFWSDVLGNADLYKPRFYAVSF
jgi:hypothetical protein